jgi:hypothetical protein
MWSMISVVCHCVLTLIGVVALAYSPVIGLALYVRLRVGGATIKPAGERLHCSGSPEASHE